MKKITRFLFCTFVAIMLMGTAISATACHQKEEYPSVPEVTEPQPTGEIIPTVDRQKELKDARKKYADAVAWLYMPGAEVDDPVVQAKDNAYYLQKDENGNYSEWGCYYAHCDNRLSSRSKLDRNTVIFGHSASNCDPDGPKLTKLHRYMDADYVKENPYVYLSVKGEDMVFQITACFITDIDFDYIAPNPTGEELTNFFEQVAKKNWLEFDGVTFGEEDTVLTLSTCCRKYDEYNTGNQRLVLMAKLLPEGAVAQASSYAFNTSSSAAVVDALRVVFSLSCESCIPKSAYRHLAEEIISRICISTCPLVKELLLKNENKLNPKARIEIPIATHSVMF